MLALVRDFNALAVLVREGRALAEHVQLPAIERQPSRRTVCLQALGGQEVDGRPIELLARREQTAARLVLVCERAQLVRHPHPGVAERLRPVGIRRLRRLLQRRAHLLDLADARAHLDREIDGEIPDVVGRKVPEHGR